MHRFSCTEVFRSATQPPGAQTQRKSPSWQNGQPRWGGTRHTRSKKKGASLASRRSTQPARPGQGTFLRQAFRLIAKGGNRAIDIPDATSLFEAWSHQQVFRTIAIGIGDTGPLTNAHCPLGLPGGEAFSLLSGEAFSLLRLRSGHGQRGSRRDFWQLVREVSRNTWLLNAEGRESQRTCPDPQQAEHAMRFRKMR